MRRLLAILATLAVLLITFAQPVAAAKPFIDRFTDTGSGPDPFLTEECGIPVTFEFRFSGTAKFFPNRDVSTFHFVNHLTLRSAEGKVLIREAATVVSEFEEVVDEAAGTVTITFSDTFKGLPIHIVAPGEGVLVRDAGQVTFQGRIVFDIETGEVISEQFDVVDVKGPHPLLFFTDEDFEELERQICAALT